MTGQLSLLSVFASLCLHASAWAGAPVMIAQGTGLQAPRQPQLAVSSEGNVHLVFGSGNSVFYACSTDDGGSFTPAARAFDCPNMSLGKRRGPRIAIAKETVVVTAIGGESGKGRDGDLFAWRRNATGEWLGPVRVNDVEDSAREGLHAMASGPDGAVWCCWLDMRIKGTQVYASSSSDGGANWSPNVLVYRSPGGSVCECCHPSIVVGPDGRLHVLFRNSIEGKRDMYLVSANLDGSFGAGKKLEDRE